MGVKASVISLQSLEKCGQIFGIKRRIMIMVDGLERAFQISRRVAFRSPCCDAIAKDLSARLHGAVRHFDGAALFKLSQSVQNFGGAYLFNWPMADKWKNIDFQSVDNGLAMPARPTGEVFFCAIRGR